MLSVGAHAIGPSRYAGLYYAGVEVKYQNTSGKRIRSLRFEGKLFNAFNEVKRLELNDSDELAPGKTTTSLWTTTCLSHPVKNGAVVILIKVAFDDGTIWEQTGDSPVCEWKNDRDISTYKLSPNRR